MQPTWDLLGKYWWILAVLIVLAARSLIFRLFGAVIIPQDSIGVVNKKYALIGKNRTLPNGCIIALHGEAGVQADTLAPGIHFGFYPWQYEIKIDKFVTIFEGKVGVVEARDGKPLTAGRVLARRVECDSFQDARKFLANGGERGPQITVIPPGTYRVNSGLFSVVQEPVLPSTGTFDRCIRALRPRTLLPLLEMAYQALPADGVMLLHTIVRPTFKELRRRGLTLTRELVHFSEFILSEIFPGGWLPTASVVEEHAAKAGFTVTRIQSLQPHYARTLDVGGRSAGQQKSRPLRCNRKEVYDRYMKYLTGCATLFHDGYTDVNQFTLQRTPLS